MLSLTLGFLALGSWAHAGTLERLLPLKASYMLENQIQILEGTVLRMQNDWTTRLRNTTITDIRSGGRMAQIERIEAGQTVNLEFSRKGAYSICYFSGPLKMETRRCLNIHVVMPQTT